MSILSAELIHCCYIGIGDINSLSKLEDLIFCKLRSIMVITSVNDGFRLESWNTGIRVYRMLRTNTRSQTMNNNAI